MKWTFVIHFQKLVNKVIKFNNNNINNNNNNNINNNNNNNGLFKPFVVVQPNYRPVHTINVTLQN